MSDPDYSPFYKRPDECPDCAGFGWKCETCSGTGKILDTHPRCRRCDVPMRAGQVFAPVSLAGLPDFGEYEPNMRGQTMTEGHGVMVRCWKCPDCGHSFVAPRGQPSAGGGHGG